MHTWQRARERLKESLGSSNFDVWIKPLRVAEMSDGRVLFAIPWHDRVLVGTTDTPIDEPTLEPRAHDEEIAFILETADRYLEGTIDASAVRSVFTGIRRHLTSLQLARSGAGVKQLEAAASNIPPSQLGTLFFKVGYAWVP